MAIATGEVESKALARRIAGVLERHPDVLGAYLFGSRARDGVRPESDADIAVVFDHPPALERLVELETELEDALSLEVDVIDLAGAGAFLALEAVRGERVFERDGLVLDQLDLYILRRAGDLAHFERERRRALLEARPS
jgi:uncharacterized protein